MKDKIASLGGVLIMICSFVFAAFSKADDPFFNKASQANLAEIQAGKLAETRGSGKVKEYGAKMVADYTVAENELVHLAKKQNLNLATRPDAAHRQALADLSSLSGNAFNASYMESQLADHQVAVSLFKDEAANGQNPALRSYAGKYLPNLEMHLQMFKGVNSNMAHMATDTMK